MNNIFNLQKQNTFYRGSKIALALFLISFLSFIPYNIINNTSKEALAVSRDCDSNAVIYCGAYSKDELLKKIKNGDDKHSDIKKLFGAIGIYDNDIASPRTYDGVVKKDGTVWVGNSKVASGVYSSGRKNMASSTSWSGLYWRSPSVSFRSESIPAFVYMYEGKFQYAVIKSCGNPVLADLKPIKPALAMNLKVSNTTRDPVWRDSNKAQPGDTLKYQLYFKSTGPVTLEGATIKSTMPANTSFVSGSGKVKVGKKVFQVSENDIKGGTRVGDLVSKQDGYLYFKVRVNNALSNPVNLPVTGYADGDYVSQINDRVTTAVAIPVERHNLTARVFNDTNQDGDWDSGETAIGAWNIEVAGTNFQETLTTNANGQAQRNNLLEGIYTVTGESRQSWNYTTQRIQTVVLDRNRTVDFGVVQTPVIVNQVYALTIYQYNDIDGDAQKDANEPLLPDWIFLASSPSLNVQVTTNSQGSYALANLVPGTFRVEQLPQSGWTTTTAAIQNLTLPTTQAGLNGNGEIWFGSRQDSPEGEPEGDIDEAVTPQGTSTVVTAQAQTQTPIQKGAALPQAGAASAVGAVGGIGIVYAAITRYLRSKKELLEALLNK